MSATPAVATGPWPRRMVNTVQGYDWGSTTTLARIQGRAATGEPEAELWMGAHPSAPSGVETVEGDVVPLDRLIAAAPGTVLGTGVEAVFGPRLPYLLKILAIDKPLSVQVHPTAERAAAAYAGEVGVAGEHRYVDPFHKPELAYALEPTDVLCGFRSADRAAYLLGLVDCPRIRTVAEPLLSEEADDVECVEEAFRVLVTWPEDDRAALAADVAEQARSLLASAGPLDPDDEDALGPSDRRALTWAVRLARLHPKDPLVAAPFLLHLVRLDPGHTLFVPAGAPHAYLYGTVVEIMANSDNVLRCGLTGKHIDVPELLKITDFTALAEPRCPTQPLGAGSHRFATPVADFALTLIDLDEAAGHSLVDEPGPHVVLCASGSARVGTPGATVALTPGRAAFVGPRGDAFTVAGTGQAFAATVGSLR